MIKLAKFKKWKREIFDLIIRILIPGGWSSQIASYVTMFNYHYVALNFTLEPWGTCHAVSRILFQTCLSIDKEYATLYPQRIL